MDRLSEQLAAVLQPAADKVNCRLNALEQSLKAVMKEQSDLQDAVEEIKNKQTGLDAELEELRANLATDGGKRDEDVQISLERQTDQHHKLADAVGTVRDKYNTLSATLEGQRPSRRFPMSLSNATHEHGQRATPEPVTCSALQSPSSPQQSDFARLSAAIVATPSFGSDGGHRNETSSSGGMMSSMTCVSDEARPYDVDWVRMNFLLQQMKQDEVQETEDCITITRKRKPVHITSDKPVAAQGARPATLDAPNQTRNKRHKFSRSSLDFEAQVEAELPSQSVGSPDLGISTKEVQDAVRQARLFLDGDGASSSRSYNKVPTQIRPTRDNTDISLEGMPSVKKAAIAAVVPKRVVSSCRLSTATAGTAYLELLKKFNPRTEPVDKSALQSPKSALEAVPSNVAPRPRKSARAVKAKGLPHNELDPRTLRLRDLGR